MFHLKSVEKDSEAPWKLSREYDRFVMSVMTTDRGRSSIWANHLLFLTTLGASQPCTPKNESCSWNAQDGTEGHARPGLQIQSVFKITKYLDK